MPHRMLVCIDCGIAPFPVRDEVLDKNRVITCECGALSMDRQMTWRFVLERVNGRERVWRRRSVLLYAGARKIQLTTRDNAQSEFVIYKPDDPRLDDVLREEFLDRLVRRVLLS